MGGQITVNDLLQITSMILASAIAYTIYLIIDKKYKITNKIDLKLHIKQKWKACFCVSCLMISLLIIGILGIYIIDIQPIVYYIISGVLVGVGNGMAYKLNSISR